MNWWNIAVIIFNTLLGVFIFSRMWKYINKEMSTAPTYSKFDSVKKTLSSVLFALITTVTILFVVTFITSTIAINALYALGEASEITQTIIAAWQFPNFLPITLIVITGFSFLYPLYEYFLLAQPEKQATMEIQKKIEEEIIQKVSSPWSYGIAFLWFLFVVVLAPTLLSIYMVYVAAIPGSSGGALSRNWTIALIFFAWLILGPTIYLSYYGKLGAAHIVYRSRRVDLKKDKKTGILLFFAIISIISTIFSFFNYIPILWGNFPEATRNYAEAQGGFIQEFILLVIPQDNVEAWLNFNAIVPIDFLLFIFTTVVIGFIGFYIKFLRKEPINRTSVVLFATYIFIGIAFSIFLNAMIKWPWVFPDQRLSAFGLNLDFENPAHQDIIVRLFSTTILAEKTINLVFLINFFFFTPEIKQNADEWVLNRAILKNDFKTITKYVKNDNPEMRKMALRSIVSYVKISDKLEEDPSKQISGILGELLLDENPEISKTVNENVLEIVQKLWLEKIVDHLITILQTDDEKKHKKAIAIIKTVAEQNPKRALRAFKQLLNANISELGKQRVLRTVKEVATRKKEITKELAFSLFDTLRFDKSVILTLFDIISMNIAQFTSNKEYLKELEDILIQYLNAKDPKLVARSLDIYATIAQYKPDRLKEFEERYLNLPKIHDKRNILLRSKIGALTKIIISYPERYWDFFEHLEKILAPEKDEETWTETTDLISNPEALGRKIEESQGKTKKIEKVDVIDKDQQQIEIKSDIALALGSITANIDEETFTESIFPHIIQLIMEPHEEIKIATLKSIIVIAKTRGDIYQIPTFQLLLGKLMVDSNEEIRRDIFQLIEETNLEQLIIYLTEYLSHDIDLKIKIEMLNLLSRLGNFVVGLMDKVNLLGVLMTQDFSESKKVDINEFISIEKEEQAFFNVKFDEEIDQIKNIQAFGNVSLLGATIALLYELSIHNKQIHEEVQEFLEDNAQTAGALALIKKVQFHSLSTLNILKNNPEKNCDVEFLDAAAQPVVHHIESSNIIIRKIISDFLSKLIMLTPEYHTKIFSNAIKLVLSKEISLNSPSIIRNYLNISREAIRAHPELYLTETEMTKPLEKKLTTLNPFNTYIKPVLYESMVWKDDVLWKSLKKFAARTFRIQDNRFEKIPEEEREYRRMLGEREYPEVIRSAFVEILEETEDVQAKIRSIKILLKSPFEIKTEQMAKFLLKEVKTKDSNLKAKVIDAVGHILKGYEEFPSKNKPKSYKMFRKLLIKVFINTYDPEAAQKVKWQIVRYLAKLAKTQKNISLIIRQIIKIAQDPDLNVAKKAISAYFDYITASKDPKIQRELLTYLHSFILSDNLEISYLVIKEIVNAYKSGIGIQFFIPTIVRLASSHNHETRERVFSVFTDLYKKNPEKFRFFIDIAIELTNHKDMKIRRDATKGLFSLMLTVPEKVGNNKLLFRSYRNLALDEDPRVRYIVSSFLGDLVETFPSRIREILQVIFIFINSGENTIMQNTGYAVKIAIKKHPEYKDEVIDSLKRYYKKSQDGMLYTLINELS